MSTQLYSLEEVKKHADNREAWIVIHNNVYNVTPFLNEHPGGEEVLLEQAGKEASEAFEDVGHSSDARDLMQKYKIGELIELERKEVKAKSFDWASSSDNNSTAQSSFNSWILPISLGILATIFYRIYFQS